MRVLHYAAYLLRASLSLATAGAFTPAAAAEMRATAPAQLAQGSAQIIIAPSAPPPPREEPPPPAPGPSTIWETGHWSWNGHDWVWVHGQYLVRPAPTMNWVPGHWVEQLGGWSWVEGHWQ